MTAEIIGWAAAVVLLMTIATQVVTQWRARSSQGLSPWLFSGQVIASAGFTVYSVLLGNAVFAITNGLILVSAAFGQLLYWRYQRGKPGVMQKLVSDPAMPPRRRKKAARRAPHG